jgi:hypothetical protein
VDEALWREEDVGFPIVAGVNSSKPPGVRDVGVTKTSLDHDVQYTFKCSYLNDWRVDVLKLSFELPHFLKGWPRGDRRAVMGIKKYLR